MTCVFNEDTLDVVKIKRLPGITFSFLFDITQRPRRFILTSNRRTLVFVRFRAESITQGTVIAKRCISNI